MKALNLNDVIKVKLTDYGKDIFYHQYDELNNRIAANGGNPSEPRYPDVGADGYTKFQLWHFMRLYGEHMKIAGPKVIDPLNIYIEEKDLEEC